MHFTDVTLQNGREQAIMAAVGGGGMFRYYEGTSILDAAYVARPFALSERGVVSHRTAGKEVSLCTEQRSRRRRSGRPRRGRAGQLGGGGGARPWFRYISHALEQKRLYGLFTIFAVRESSDAAKRRAEIAAFLLVRGP